MTQRVDPPSRQGRHYNSLGYATHTQFADDGRTDPVTVWAYAANGERVSIHEAESGGRQGLRCICGSGLIAAKGEVYAHHFRHENGVICQAAYTEALRTFLSHTFASANSVKLPTFQSKVVRTSIASVSDANHETLAVVDLKTTDGRSLLVVAMTKKQELAEVSEMAKAADVSAISIDLRRYRSMTDEAIRAAIVEHAPRTWLHFRGQKLPATKRPTPAPLADPPNLSEIKRRLFPDIFG